MLLNCQNNKNSEESIIKPKTKEVVEEFQKSSGVLVSNQQHFDYEIIEKGYLIEQDFVFYNTGDQLVQLIEYEASCNCTEIEASKIDIEPKDSVSIKMVVDTKDKHKGQHKVTATLKTNGQRTFYYLSTTFEIE